MVTFGDGPEIYRRDSNPSSNRGWPVIRNVTHVTWTSKDGILRKLLPTKAKDATIETTQVPALVLDTLLRNTTGIRLIKIDTQGAEEAVACK